MGEGGGGGDSNSATKGACGFGGGTASVNGGGGGGGEELQPATAASMGRTSATTKGRDMAISRDYTASRQTGAALNVKVTGTDAPRPRLGYFV